MLSLERLKHDAPQRKMAAAASRTAGSVRRWKSGRGRHEGAANMSAQTRAVKLVAEMNYRLRTFSSASSGGGQLSLLHCDACGRCFQLVWCRRMLAPFESALRVFLNHNVEDRCEEKAEECNSKHPSEHGGAERL